MGVSKAKAAIIGAGRIVFCQMLNLDILRSVTCNYADLNMIWF